MDRKIVGFDLDDVGDWIAVLECGHRQHVRHDPPWQVREWVTTEPGRRGRLGTTLFCSMCAEAEMPIAKHIEKPVRITGVTLGLVATGAVSSSVVFMVLLGILGLVVDGPGGFPGAWMAYVLAALAGAPAGAIGVPLLSWLFLRDVPLGRIIAMTSLGAVVGGSAGVLLSGRNPTVGMVGAALGAVGGAAFLRKQAQQGSDEPS